MYSLYHIITYKSTHNVPYSLLTYFSYLCLYAYIGHTTSTSVFRINIPHIKYSM